MKELIAALVKAQQGFKPIKKEKINPFYKTKYADLDSVIESTKTALCENGLVVSQTVSVKEVGTLLITTIWHESGESLASEYPLPKAEDPQKLGSAITYARRYALCAILGVTAEDDDDGNSNSHTVKPRTQAKAQSNPYRDKILQAAKAANIEGRENLIAVCSQALEREVLSSSDITTQEECEIVCQYIQECVLLATVET